MFAATVLSLLFGTQTFSQSKNLEKSGMNLESL